MWFVSKPKNRAFERRHVLDVKVARRQAITYSVDTSLLAFQAAPMPMSTGSVTTAQATAITGRAEIVTRRTTPDVRSATRIV